MKRNQAGFTLIELLLVMVIVSMVIYMGLNYVQQRTLTTRIDRTSLQMQQVLNAGLSYYLNNGRWPTSVNCLKATPSTTGCTVPYLPATFVSPWGAQYSIASPSVSGSTPHLLYVYTRITSASASGTAAAAAKTIAGKLPLAYTTTNSASGSNPPASGAECDADATTCNVVASVNIPGQNLNNATAVNFGNVYSHGGCVPVPDCPVDYRTGTTMTASILVVPISVSGFNDEGSNNVYPISSFTAYATSNTGTSPPTNARPPYCTRADGSTESTINIGTRTCSGAVNNVGQPATRYWRVCLRIITVRGEVSQTNPSTDWGNKVRLLAITRCAANNEPSGTRFNVYSN